MSKTLTELTTLNKHPFIQNLRKAAQENGNRFTNTISLAATDTYGDKAVAKAKPEWGSFSGVFSDKHSVLKVYHDPAYHDFVKYAQSHQDDPHMPKIYSHVRTSDGIGLVRMEKLKDLRDGNVYDPKNPANNRTNQHFSDTGVFAPYNEELWQARTGAGLHGLLHDVPGKVMRQSQPSFHKSLSNLSFHFANKTFDMHPGNVMQRADGTPVITDPLWDEHHWVKARKGKASDLLSGKRGVLEEMMTLNKYPFKWEDRWHSAYMNNKLGSGTYAHVFDREKHNSVIKVFQNDPAYEDFLDYAKANQDNPHIPKIYAHKKLSDGTHAVRIEKLQKNPTDPKVQDLFGHPETGQEHAYIVGKDEPIFGKKDPHFNRMENVTKNFPKLVDTFHHMTATSPYHHEWDFGSIAHSHNMMWRDNTPVITDPWYSRGKPKKVLAEMMTLNKHPLGSKLADLPDDVTPHGYKRDPGVTVRNAIFRHYGGKSYEGSEGDTGYANNHLGTGMYGSAYAHKNHVIKVYRNDHSYDDFIHYAKAHQDNPHLPKIYAHKLLNTSNQTGIVKLEKLDPVPAEHYDALQFIRSNGNEIYRHGNPPYRAHIKDFEDFKKNYPTLHTTLEHFGKYGFPTKRSLFDLHSGNVMYRPSTGHIVLTDPIANAD